MKTELRETGSRVIKEGMPRQCAHVQAAAPWRAECPPALRLSAEITPRPGRAG
ncbi:MAG: hypothetical protein ACLPT6_14285 [Desulfobaccales bacterium]